MLFGIVAAAVLEPEDLRQPLGQRPIGFDFVQRGFRPNGMGDDQFFAICWGHASPFNLR